MINTKMKNKIELGARHALLTMSSIYVCFSKYVGISIVCCWQTSKKYTVYNANMCRIYFFVVNCNAKRFVWFGLK